MCFADWLKIQLLSGKDLDDDTIGLLRRSWQHGEISMRKKVYIKVRDLAQDKGTGRIENKGAEMLLNRIKGTRLDKG